MDLTRAFLAKFKLCRRIICIIYEGIHLICFYYG
ncbi:hypothetical protein NC653_034908 [Populus alba x Populus x berolinensis]|uniref:Uncharacterized protein n=1 Tax=Populus alba x Populus x berolinensis TaxID=444605 RepID=A0AAD6PXN2_9ROSI|nr:hypothetical protein NC653_034908 [Populus alba x Populus x berolinensis]